jgi:hypothetical protein
VSFLKNKKLVKELTLRPNTTLHNLDIFDLLYQLSILKSKNNKNMDVIKQRLFDVYSKEKIEEEKNKKQIFKENKWPNNKSKITTLTNIMKEQEQNKAARNQISKETERNQISKETARNQIRKEKEGKVEKAENISAQKYNKWTPSTSKLSANSKSYVPNNSESRRYAWNNKKKQQK